MEAGEESGDRLKFFICSYSDPSIFILHYTWRAQFSTNKTKYVWRSILGVQISTDRVASRGRTLGRAEYKTGLSVPSSDLNRLFVRSTGTTSGFPPPMPRTRGPSSQDLKTSRRISGFFLQQERGKGRMSLGKNGGDREARDCEVERGLGHPRRRHGVKKIRRACSCRQWHCLPSH